MAAAIAHKIFGGAIEAESAGVSAPNGDSAASNAIAVMAKKGMDISGHRARQIDALTLSSYDRIVALDVNVAWRLRRLGVNSPVLIELNVPDPIGADVKRYDETADLIEHELRRIFAAL
jgi:protein-tyrosine-phosphatase